LYIEIDWFLSRGLGLLSVSKHLYAYVLNCDISINYVIISAAKFTVLAIIYR